MKRKTKLSISILTLFIACFVMSNNAAAQWSIGASYQVRNDNPKKGFGLKIQKQILTKLPLVDIGVRAHFSYFNENNNITKNSITLGEVTYYDFGIDAVGGVGLGILEPYVGIGVGSNKYKLKQVQNGEEFSDSKFYWNTFAGVELTILPVLHPFIEYRFVPTSDFDFKQMQENWNFDSNGRLVIGLVLSF